MNCVKTKLHYSVLNEWKQKESFNMAAKKTWRQYYAPQIAAIIKSNEGKSVKELKKILCDANPGMYGHHKKTWANEYMIQLGLSKKKKGHRADPKNQSELF